MPKNRDSSGTTPLSHVESYRCRANALPLTCGTRREHTHGARRTRERAPVPSGAAACSAAHDASKLGVCCLGCWRRLRNLGRFVLLQYLNEVPIRISKRHDEPKAVVGRADGLNTARGQPLGNGPHTRRAKHHDRTLSIPRRNAGEPCAGMNGEMHAANIAPVVKRDPRVLLIFQR
jgi:hypothetical protein